MRAIKCLRQALQHMKCTRLTVRTFICSQNVASELSISNNVPARLNKRKSSLYQYDSCNAFNKSSISIQPAPLADRTLGAIRECHGNSEQGKPAAGNTSTNEKEGRKEINGGLSASRMGAGAHQAPNPSESTPDGQAAADHSSPRPQESSSAQDSHAVDSSEATGDGAPEEQRYAAEFQRIAGKNAWLPVHVLYHRQTRISL